MLIQRIGFLLQNSVIDCHILLCGNVNPSRPDLGRREKINLNFYLLQLSKMHGAGRGNLQNRTLLWLGYLVKMEDSS